MRHACPECGLIAGHYDTCTVDPPPRRVNVGNPLLMDAIVQSGHRQTWTA